MFAYCGNNPVMRADPSGKFWITTLIIVAVTAVVTKIVCTVNQVNRVKKEIKSIPNSSNDITNDLNKKMQDNGKTMQNYKKDNGIINATKKFKNKVQNKGEWDLKQSYPDPLESFKFNGINIQPQDIGNIHYGYVGRAMGLPKSVLLLGGSYAQLSAGTSNFSMFITTGGDDLRDQMYIMYGIMLYEEGK